MVLPLGMLFRILFLSMLLFGFCKITQAQRLLKGHIFRSTNESPLAGASVTNLRTQQISVSTINGTYSIAAIEGDQVIFSYIGLNSDTVKIEGQLLLSGYDASLTEKSNTLSNVTVTGSYQADSLQRRQAYSEIYEKPAGITGRNTPQYGAGIVLSPVSFFSKNAKQKRVLKKQLLKQEEDDYIDYVFAPSWVSSITGLTGDSLNLFMYQYRPSYSFARQHDRAGLTLYVSDKLKEFKKK